MSKLLIQEPPLQVLPSLAKEIGLNEAIVIQQLHYWMLRSETSWVYNTLEAWGEQFPFWSANTIQRIFTKLKEAGLIAVKRGKGTNRTNYYQIKYDAIPMTPDWGEDDPTLGSSLEEAETTQRKSRSKKKESTEEAEKIWAYYVALSNARRKEIDDTQRRVIQQALQVATPRECCQAIRALFASDFHQKRGEYVDRSGAKYRAITDALKGRPRNGESTRQRIDKWIDEDEEPQVEEEGFFAGTGFES